MQLTIKVETDDQNSVRAGIATLQVHLTDEANETLTTTTPAQPAQLTNAVLTELLSEWRGHDPEPYPAYRVIHGIARNPNGFDTGPLRAELRANLSTRLGREPTDAEELASWAGYFTQIGKLLKRRGHRVESIYRKTSGGIYSMDAQFADRVRRITDRIDHEWEAR